MSHLRHFAGCPVLSFQFKDTVITVSQRNYVAMVRGGWWDLSGIEFSQYLCLPTVTM
jgi:hypothetical protein